MSTPAAKEETPEEVAERIAKTYAPSHAARAHLRQAVLSALRNEQEACAKVAEDPSNISMAGGSTGDAHGTSKRIAAAIRGRTE